MFQLPQCRIRLDRCLGQNRSKACELGLPHVPQTTPHSIAIISCPNSARVYMRQLKLATRCTLTRETNHKQYDDRYHPASLHNLQLLSEGPHPHDNLVMVDCHKSRKDEHEYKQQVPFEILELEEFGYRPFPKSSVDCFMVPLDFGLSFRRQNRLIVTFALIQVDGRRARYPVMRWVVLTGICHWYTPVQAGPRGYNCLSVYVVVVSQVSGERESRCSVH